MRPHMDDRKRHPRAPAPLVGHRRTALLVGGAIAVALLTALPAASAIEAPGRAAPARGPAAVAEPTRQTGGTTRHVVQPGETLSGIAARYGVSVDALASVNGIADPDRIRHGATLDVPDPGARSGGAGNTGLPERLIESPARLALRPVMARWADANGIPTDLLEATTWLESGWQSGLVSPDGAIGIGQLMPSTVTFMEELIGADLDPYVAEENIRMAARYLRWLLARTATVEDALAGYYQGLASVEANGRFGETERYIANVMALRDRF